jgi:hypothetical protein
MKAPGCLQHEVLDDATVMVIDAADGGGGGGAAAADTEGMIHHSDIRSLRNHHQQGQGTGCYLDTISRLSGNRGVSLYAVGCSIHHHRLTVVVSCNHLAVAWYCCCFVGTANTELLQELQDRVGHYDY